MRRTIIAIMACLFSLSGFLPSVYSLPWPPEMDLIYIKFNYNSSSYSYDALTIKKNNSTGVQVPEWYPAYNRNEPMAYIKSQSDRFIEARFWIDRTGFNYAGIYADMSGSGIGDVPEQSVNFNDTQYATQTLECSGSVPNSVGIRSFSWNWYVTYIDEVEFEEPIWIAESGEHEYYTVLDEPQAPMSVPWTDVLDYSCDWASGQSSEANVVKKITEGIYNMGDIDGDIDYDYSSYYCTDYDKLKLGSFLDDITSKNNVKVNCTDCGNLVDVFTAAVGSQSHSKRIWSGIKTKEIDPIGSIFGWRIVYWSYHQYGWINNLVDDSSLRVDRYGTPRVPTNMSQSDYNYFLIDGNPPANSQVYTTQIVEQ
ncbi:MAG: hypothetical protein ONB37_17180 [candidate division KSB1 bacterium]|nr:hypothetical protein [candidate division KSB1 bacterium]